MTHLLLKTIVASKTCVLKWKLMMICFTGYWNPSANHHIHLIIKHFYKEAPSIGKFLKTYGYPLLICSQVTNFGWKLLG